DGGLTITENGTSGRDRASLGWMVGGQVDFAEFRRFGIGGGKLGGYYEERAKGFSTITQQTPTDLRIWGTHVALPITSFVELGAKFDELKDGNGQRKRDSDLTLSWQFDRYWKAAFGVSYSELHSPRAISSGKSGYNGTRTDVGVRVDYRQNADHLYYG